MLVSSPSLLAFDPFEHGKYFPPRSPKIMLENCFSAGDVAVLIPASETLSAEREALML